MEEDGAGVGGADEDVDGLRPDPGGQNEPRLRDLECRHGAEDELKYLGLSL